MRLGAEASTDSGTLDAVTVCAPEDAFERIADALACRIVSPPSPWLDAEGAARYLRCPASRVRKLTMTGELPCHKDGRRVLYDRAELDAYVRNGGAYSP